jgi:phosphoribosylaminoimidazolecarboxamide formyltransferase/IMP cyclohydrolase
MTMAGNVVQRIDDRVPVRHVLASVSDKTGLDELVRGLVRVLPGVRILSTGGTHERIADVLGERATRLHLRPVSDYTGQPETQGGLVKTLDFKIYLGLLTETYNEAHRADLARAHAVPIDMVVCNLYPFARTVARAGVTVEEARAEVDVGGPCMVRAAAKNYLRVASVVDPADYPRVLRALEDDDGRTTLALRYDLARKAFAHTAAYDAEIAAFLAARPAAAAAACYALEDR